MIGASTGAGYVFVQIWLYAHLRLCTLILDVAIAVVLRFQYVLMADKQASSIIKNRNQEFVFEGMVPSYGPIFVERSWTAR